MGGHRGLWNPGNACEGAVIDRATRRANYRLIECEIANYHKNLAQLSEMRGYIIEEGTTHDGQPRGSGISDPTGQKAIRLASTAVLLEAQRRIAAVNRALEHIAHDKTAVELVRLAFIERKSNVCVSMQVGLSERSVTRLKRRFVEHIAEDLGWIV